MKGIAINVSKFEGLSPIQIMNITIEKAKSEGAAWFSTDIRFSMDKLQQDACIFYIAEGKNNKFTFVMADMAQRITRNRDGKPFIPEDSARFSPELYKDEPKRSWILVKNFRLVTEDYMDSLLSFPEEGVEQVPVMQLIRKNRTNRFYWTDHLGMEIEEETIQL